MDALAIAVMGVAMIACFITGAKVGLAVRKDKPIDEEFQAVNPIEKFKQHKVKRENQKEQDRLEAVMQNIESYDGTSIGQRDIPRR